MRANDVSCHRNRPVKWTGRLLVLIWSPLVCCSVTVARDFPAQRWESCGLQLVWQCQTAADGYLDDLKHVVLHVSSTRSREIVEVVSGDQRMAFVPEDLDRFGRPLGVEGAARQADIQKRTWEAQGQTATIENRQIPTTTLYLQTNLGRLQALQAETGHLRWDVALGSSPLPSIPPSVDDQQLLAIYGTTLTLLDTADGRLLWQQPMADIPGNTSAVLDGTAWVPRMRGSIDVFALSAPRQTSSFMMSLGRVSNPLSVSSKALAWATDAGYLYILDLMESRPRVRLQIRDRVSAAVAQDDRGRLYFGTEGGLVAAINSDPRTVRWENLVDGAVYQAPLLLDDAVCFATDTGWLCCLDADTGESRWQRRGFPSWVARGNGRLLAVDDQNYLVALDAANGHVVGRSPLQQLRPLLSHGMTDRIFLRSRQGQILALRPVDQPWTNIYLPLRTEEEDAVEATDEGASEETAETSPPAPPPVDEAPLQPLETDDPFGADFDNPFE